ncbi:hypothetical protein BDW22DRAFT_129433 [Trametopsis cervina]|nr:hypothetical protein BDW22DRAFT_129433 [Trametopsis cervina]
MLPQNLSDPNSKMCHRRCRKISILSQEDSVATSPQTGLERVGGQSSATTTPAPVTPATRASPLITPVPIAPAPTTPVPTASGFPAHATPVASEASMRSSLVVSSPHVPEISEQKSIPKSPIEPNSSTVTLSPVSSRPTVKGSKKGPPGIRDTPAKPTNSPTSRTSHQLNEVSPTASHSRPPSSEVLDSPMSSTPMRKKKKKKRHGPPGVKAIDLGRTMSRSSHPPSRESSPEAPLMSVVEDNAHRSGTRHPSPLDSDADEPLAVRKPSHRSSEPKPAAQLVAPISSPRSASPPTRGKTNDDVQTNDSGRSNRALDDVEMHNSQDDMDLESASSTSRSTTGAIPASSVLNAGSQAEQAVDTLVSPSPAPRRPRDDDSAANKQADNAAPVQRNLHDYTVAAFTKGTFVYSPVVTPPPVGQHSEGASTGATLASPHPAHEADLDPKSELQLARQPPPLPRERVFDDHMLVLSFARGTPRSSPVTLAFELNENHMGMLERWSRRYEPSEVPTDHWCLSLACHPFSECSGQLFNSDAASAPSIFGKAPIPWPLTAHPRAALHHEQHAGVTFPLTSFSIIEDNLVDLSTMVHTGKNTIEITSAHGDTLDYVFVIHLHSPTAHQLENLRRWRNGDVAWRKLLGSFAKIQVPDFATLLTVH